MIDKILILSRFEVVQIIHNVKKPNDLFHREFILISCFGNNVNYSKNCNNEYTPNTLINDIKKDALIRQGMIDHVNVFCDDITLEQCEELHKNHPGIYTVKLFDEQNAKNVLDFVDKYKDSNCVLVAHCDAGISRSGAIGTFFAEEFGIDKNTLPNYIRPNQYILKLLKEEKTRRNK